ncbi:response regulator [Falsiroseomonas selenitidurans]|uniref:Response regulator n=1 Tax=Falsiroseomonas selenitidurans TaxID=2716335 RepID=A0ABX1E3D0_9PROT|nr:response regulator [Falsiroseomonas selenitidurans]NKC31679.1 response regulator [Falsiroseomonas selenitidurans]
MTDAPLILVVDDDRGIRDLLARALPPFGFRVATAREGREANAVLASQRVACLVLDLMLPGEDGIAICRRLRAESAVPIIMLTARGEETDRVVGLEVGADDYVPKPFGTRELVARIRALLRRAEMLPAAEPRRNAGRIGFAGWVLDLGTRVLEGADGVALSLTTGEFELLRCFIEHPRRVLTRDQLLDLARGRAATPFDRSIDLQVSRLRRKIELEAKDPQIIKTVRGGGYLFAPAIDTLG